ncbi:MAG: hypothetical protein ACO35C_03855 [Pontimonas sp.]
MKRIGDRKEVIAGRAYKTSGGLTINDFVKKPDGTWVYKKKSQSAKSRWNKDSSLRQKFNNSRAEPFVAGMRKK